MLSIRFRGDAYPLFKWGECHEVFTALLLARPADRPQRENKEFCPTKLRESACLLAKEVYGNAGQR
jgi:hypothetical protein